MRLPFWVDYHYKRLASDKSYRLIGAGWLALAALWCFILFPRAGHYLELRSLAGTVDNRLAAAEQARPEADPTAGPAAEFAFSAGAGLQAVTDACAAAGVVVTGYRPFRPDGEGAAGVQALELALEGPYPGVKTVLSWLEGGPARAEIRQVEAAAVGGGVAVRALACQQVKTAPAVGQDPSPIGPRPDIFSDGPGRPAGER